MHSEIRLNKTYLAFFTLLCLIILGETYFIGGVFPFLVVLIIIFFICYKELNYKIFIENNHLYIKNLIKSKKILLKNLKEVNFLSHSGRGRDYYLILYKYKNKLKKFRINSYKYKHIYTFIDKLKHIGIEVKKRRLKKKRFLRFILILYGLEGLIFLYFALNTSFDFFINSFNNFYHVYNNFFLWLLFSGIFIITFSYLIYLIKKNYYNLVYYRTIIFFLLGFFMIFFIRKNKIDNKQEMYNNIIKVKYKIESYYLENQDLPKKLKEFLIKDIKYESSIRKGFEKKNVKIKVIRGDEKVSKKPTFIVIVLKSSKDNSINYEIYATYLDEGKIKVINKKNKPVKKGVLFG